VTAHTLKSGEVFASLFELPFLMLRSKGQSNETQETIGDRKAAQQFSPKGNFRVLELRFSDPRGLSGGRVRRIRQLW